jgi:hypothetical protein
VKAEHLSHLHRCALQFAQGLDDADGVLDEVLGGADLLGRIRTREIERPGASHGGRNATRESTELDEPSQR